MKVYNLKDREHEEKQEPQKGPEELKEKASRETRSYLLQIDRILTAAKGIGKEAQPALYDLVQEILRNGFDAEFGGKE